MPKLLGYKDGTFQYSRTVDQQDNFGVPRRKATYVYYVLSDNLSQDQRIIETETEGLPQLGTDLLGNAVSSFKGSEINRVIHPVTGVPAALWEIEIIADSNFSVSVWGGTGGGGGQTPTDFTPVYEWAGYSEKVLVEKDVRSGLPITNTIGEPIHHEEKAVYPKLTVTRYEPYPFNPAVMYNFLYRVNSAPFKNVPIGCAYLEDIRAPMEVLQGLRWTKAEYDIIFKIIPDEFGNYEANSWDFQPLNQGTKHRVQGNPFRIVNFLDGDGNALTGNLDNVGFDLGPNDPPIFLRFGTKSYANFNALNL